MDKHANISDLPEVSPEKQAKPSVINRIIGIAAYPISAVMGFFVTHNSVRNSAYKTLIPSKAFDDIDRKFKPIAESLTKERINGTLGLVEYGQKFVENKVAHSSAVQERMEHLGRGSFLSKWEIINRGNKQAAIIEGLTVAGVAIGALLTVANSKTVGDFFAKDSPKNDNERS